jgi:tetratricopeptide (TPR) repeat protein
MSKKAKRVENKSEKRAEIVKPNALSKDDKKMAIIFGAIIFVFAFLLYAKTIPYDLVYFDDDRLILHKEKFNSDINNIPETFNETIGVTYYRPILMISFILDYQLGELETSQYRFTNVLLHAIGSLLVFVMLIYLRYPPLISFIFAMLLAAHPVLTPAAAWISGRNDSLITIFTLLSFITTIAFLKSNSNKKWIIFIVHLIFYATNLFTKESAAFFPIMALVYMYMFQREKMFKTESMILVVSWIIIGIFWFSMRQDALPPGDNPDEISVAAYIENLPALLALIGKTFFPLRMSAIANFEWVSLLAGTVAVIALLGIYVWKKESIDNRKMLFGLLWLVLFLTPTLLVRIKIDYFDYAEHRLYLPFLGILIILIEVARGLKINFKDNRIKIAAAIIFLLFAVRSFSYAGAFENGKEFWSHFVKQYRENEMGNFNLAEIFFFKNDIRRADIFYDRALKFDEENRVHNFIQMTQPSFIIPDNEPGYKRKFNHDQLNAITLYNYLANRYYLKRFPDKSIEYSQKALKISPDDPYANYLLGRSLNTIGQKHEAIRFLEIANQRKKNWSWLSELGIVYFNTEQYNKAIKVFESAIKYNSKNPQLYLNLGSAYSKINEQKKAEDAFVLALRADPKNSRVYITLISFSIDVLKDKEKAKQYLNMAQQNNIKIPEELLQRLN